MWRVVLGLAALAGCSDAPVDLGPHHGRIGLIAGGVETPPFPTQAWVFLPDATDVCASEEIIDGCTVRHVCNQAEGLHTFSAGRVELGTTPPTIVPAGQQGYVYASDYVAGDEIAVTASGGDVPAFTTSVVAPVQPVVTSRFDQTGVPVGQPLQLTWTGATTGTIYVHSFAGIDGDFALLDCQLDAAPGAGAISWAALEASQFGLIRMWGANVTTLVLGDWTLDISVGFDAVWPDGTYAQGGVRGIEP